MSSPRSPAVRRPRGHEFRRGCAGRAAPGERRIPCRQAGAGEKAQEVRDLQDPQRLTGSINLDSALARQPDYANAVRWDYGLGYRPAAERREQAVWIEVHSATTKEVDRVLRKLQWLQDWLNAGAGCLKRMTDRADADIRFVWIASGDRVDIPKNSPQARRLSQSALQGPWKKLRLP